MQNDVRSLLERYTSGQIGSDRLGTVTEEYLSSMPASEVQQRLERAADSVAADGNGEVASFIRDLLSEFGGGPAVKDAAANVIKNNPQLLQHFEPDFTQAILRRI